MNSNTKTTTDAIITGHGLMCLASHMITNGLRQPLLIRPKGDHLDVRIYSDSVDAWTDSIAVDLTAGPGRINRNRMVHREVSGRLPDTGVRVRLTWVEVQTAAPLLAVAR